MKYSLAVKINKAAFYVLIWKDLQSILRKKVAMQYHVMLSLIKEQRKMYESIYKTNG